MRYLIIIATIVTLAAPTSAVFDDVNPWTRARALGGAYAAVSDDGGAVFTNPAGLTHVNGYTFSTGYQRPFGQDYISHYTATTSASLGRYGAVGIGFSRLGVDYGGVNMTNEQAITFGYAYGLSSDITSTFSAGVSANVYMLDYAESVGGADLGNAATVGLNLGVLAVLWERTRVGAYVVNLNNPKLGDLYKEDLPQRIRFGLAYEPYTDVLTTAEVDKRLGDEASVRVGVEAVLYDVLMLRGGATTKPNTQSLGAGLRWRGIGFDYALTLHPVLPATHEFGLSYGFGGGS
jgi:hypothetical protein